MSHPANYDALLANMVTFVGTLRRAGLPVSLTQTIRLTRALRWTDLGSRDQVFHTARALLITRQADLRLFETLFNTFWRAPTAGQRRGPRVPPAPRHDAQRKRPFTIATYLAYKARRFAPEVDVVDRRETLGNEEALQAKDFSGMDAEELAAVRRAIAALRWRASERTPGGSNRRDAVPASTFARHCAKRHVWDRYPRVFPAVAPRSSRARLSYSPTSAVR